MDIIYGKISFGEKNSAILTPAGWKSDDQGLATMLNEATQSEEEEHGYDPAPWQRLIEHVAQRYDAVIDFVMPPVSSGVMVY
jgi:hypothetical protein